MAMKVEIDPEIEENGGYWKYHIHNSDELCQRIRDISCDKVVLAFSTGKDAISCWLQLRRYFDVVPFYRYIVPDLEFVEESLTYYEKRLGAKIHRYPSVSFLSMLWNAQFQTPRRALLILRELELFSDVGYDDIVDDIHYLEGCPNAWSASGIRQGDSLARWVNIEKYGPWRPNSLEFFPAYDWNLDRMDREISGAGLKLPIDYRIWNRSFDSPRARFLVGLKKHFPRDYRKILDWYPMLEADVYRREFHAESPTLATRV